MLDKTNLKYIAFFAIPVVAFSLIYVFVFSDEDVIVQKEESSTNDLSELVDEDTVIRKSKKEIYRELNRKNERKKELAGKVVSDNDFFGGSLEPRDNTEDEIERLKDSIARANNRERMLLAEKKPSDSYQRSYERKSNYNSGGGGGSYSSKPKKSSKSGFKVENFEREKEPEPVVEKQATHDDGRRRRRSSGFYNARSTRGNANSEFISGKIHESIKIRNNTVVPIRLTENSTISGNTFPRNTIIYGVANISNDRIDINVESVKYGGRVYPVDMVIYDQGDAMQGIAIRNTSTQEKAEDVKNRAGGGVNLNVPMVGNINVGNLSRNRVEEIPVYAEYKVYLKVQEQ